MSTMTVNKLEALVANLQDTVVVKNKELEALKVAKEMDFAGGKE